MGGDHAGTPENEKSLKDGGGARGGGGSNYTGSYSGTASTGSCTAPPPACSFVITQNSSFQNVSATITLQDQIAGIASIVLVSNTNDTVSVPSFTYGTTSPVIVTANKTTLGQRATVDLTVTNTNGESTTCDPGFTRVTAHGHSASTKFTGVSAKEHFITIYNAKRGLRTMTIRVNGKTYHVSLTNGHYTRLNVARAMHRGHHNTISFHGSGHKHGSAAVMIADGS